MKIGIIGSGNIGSTVGTLWVKAGHQVMFSSRNPGNLKQLVDGLGPLARAGTVAEALAYGDAIFVGVPYGAMPQLGKDYAKEFSGKIVLDAGNAVVARDGEIGKAAREAGVALTSAKLLAGARIVRAFNTINFRRLANLSNRAEGRIANSHGRRRSRSAEDRLTCSCATPDSIRSCLAGSNARNCSSKADRYTDKKFPRRRCANG